MAGYTFNLGTARGVISIDSSQLKEADISLRQAGRAMLGFGTLAVGAFAYVIKVGADFEKEMDFVSAVTEASASDMEKLKDAALELGKQGPYGPREVAAAFVDLAKAGLTAKEIIDGAAKATVGLAAAGDLPLTKAAEIAVNTMRTFNIAAGDLSKTVDILAGAANASTVDVEDLSTSLKYAGAIAHAVGIPFNEVAAALAILGNQGIRGSTAGTSLRRIFLNLTPTTKAAAKALEKLGIITEDGTNKFLDAAGNTKPLTEVFEILKQAVKGLPANEVKDLLNTIFGARAVPAALILTEKGAAGFADMMDQIERTSAADVAKERLDNLSGAIKRFKAAVEATFIEAGTPFQDFLKNVVENLRTMVLWFGKLPRPVQTAILGFVGMAGVLALLAGGFLLTVGNMVRAVRVIGEIQGALKVLGPILGAVNTAIWETTVAILASPIFWIIAVIIALAAAFYLLYTRSQQFRDGVDAIWQWMQDVWDKISKTVVDAWHKIEDFFKNWEVWWQKIKNAMGGAWSGIRDFFGGIIDWAAKAGRAVGDFFGNIGEKIGGVFSSVKGLGGDIFSALVKATASLPDPLTAVGVAFDTITGIFRQLPGLVQKFVTGAGQMFLDFLGRIPYLAGYVIGFMAGRFLRVLIDAGKAFLELGKAAIKGLSRIVPAVQKFLVDTLHSIVNWGVQLVHSGIQIGLDFTLGFMNWLEQLPARLIQWGVQMLTTLVQWGQQFVLWALQTSVNMFTGFISFLQQLPLRLLELFTQILNTIITVGQQWVLSMIQLGTNMVTGLLQFLQTLPQRIRDIFISIVQFLVDIIPKIITAAVNIGQSIAEGLIRGIGDLWGMVVRRFEDIVRGVANLAQSAFNAARDFASGLWHGFQKGLFGSPHTKIEYAVWEMEDNVADVLANLKRQVRGFQQASNMLSGTTLTGVPATLGPGMGSSNQNTVTYINNVTNNVKASVRTDGDIPKLSRQLKADSEQATRARG